jgi:hypothetical protein
MLHWLYTHELTLPQVQGFCITNAGQDESWDTYIASLYHVQSAVFMVKRAAQSHRISAPPLSRRSQAMDKNILGAVGLLMCGTIAAVPTISLGSMEERAKGAPRSSLYIRRSSTR